MSEIQRKGADSVLQKTLTEQARLGQSANHTKFTAAPTTAQVPEGGIVIVTVSGTSYVYTKINGALYRVALTAV